MTVDPPDVSAEKNTDLARPLRQPAIGWLMILASVVWLFVASWVGLLVAALIVHRFLLPPSAADRSFRTSEGVIRLYADEFMRRWMTGVILAMFIWVAWIVRSFRPPSVRAVAMVGCAAIAVMTLQSTRDATIELIVCDVIGLAVMFAGISQLCKLPAWRFGNQKTVGSEFAARQFDIAAILKLTVLLAALFALARLAVLPTRGALYWIVMAAAWAALTLVATMLYLGSLQPRMANALVFTVAALLSCPLAVVGMANVEQYVSENRKAVDLHTIRYGMLFGGFYMTSVVHALITRIQSRD